MWHMEIQEGRLADVRRTVQEQAEAARRSLQMRADEQLRQEKEAYRKAERNRLLRIRWAAPARGPRLATSSRLSGSHRLEPRPHPSGARAPLTSLPVPPVLPASRSSCCPCSPGPVPFRLCSQAAGSREGGAGAPGVSQLWDAASPSQYSAISSGAPRPLIQPLPDLSAVSADPVPQGPHLPLLTHLVLVPGQPRPGLHDTFPVGLPALYPPRCPRPLPVPARRTRLFGTPVPSGGGGAGPAGEQVTHVLLSPPLHHRRKSMYLQKEHGLRHQKLVEDARKNHRVAVKFLKASLGR